jgi:hypothetical protein
LNFLLHRHFAKRETGSDAIAFGAMLPDLARLVDRRWRPGSVASTGEPISQVLDALHHGIAHHLEADTWFHRTRVFREGEKRTAAALRDAMGPAGADLAPRLGLFGHVTWEMCLDGAWLRRSGDVDARIAELARDVERFAPEANDALREATPASPGSALDERLAILWSRLPDLAAGYAIGDGVARRLDGIRRSLRLPAASDEVRARWAIALETCLSDAADSLPDLERERSEALTSSRASATA